MVHLQFTVLTFLTLLSPEEAALFTSIVATAAEQQQSVDVLTSEDVRKAIQVEADKQSMGCDDEASCLAEIAGAMGARAIIYGSVGELGELKLVTLNLYDTADGKSGGRVVVRGKTLEELSDSLEEKVTTLVAKWRQGQSEADRELRLLVMDLEVQSRDDSRNPWLGGAVAKITSTGRWPLNPWYVGSVGMGLLGVAGLVAGVVSDGLAQKIYPEAQKAGAASEAGQEFRQYQIGSMVGIIVGGGMVMVAAGLAAVGWLE